MITPSRCTTDMYKYINSKLEESATDMGIKVFKNDDKPADYKGKYIAINCLPFTYGQAISRLNVMNINLHVPQLKKGGPDTIKMDEMVEFISSIIPTEEAYEESQELFLNGIYYCIHTLSKPLEDTDNTYFYNIRLSLTFK